MSSNNWGPHDREAIYRLIYVVYFCDVARERVAATETTGAAHELQQMLFGVNKDMNHKRIWTAFTNNLRDPQVRALVERTRLKKFLSDGLESGFCIPRTPSGLVTLEGQNERFGSGSNAMQSVRDEAKVQMIPEGNGIGPFNDRIGSTSNALWYAVSAFELAGSAQAFVRSLYDIKVLPHAAELAKRVASGELTMTESKAAMKDYMETTVLRSGTCIEYAARNYVTAELAFVSALSQVIFIDKVDGDMYTTQAEQFMFAYDPENNMKAEEIYKAYQKQMDEHDNTLRVLQKLMDQIRLPTNRTVANVVKRTIQPITKLSITEQQKGKGHGSTSLDFDKDGEEMPMYNTTYRSEYISRLQKLAESTTKMFFGKPPDKDAVEPTAASEKRRKRFAFWLLASVTRLQKTAGKIFLFLIDDQVRPRRHFVAARGVPPTAEEVADDEKAIIQWINKYKNARETKAYLSPYDARVKEACSTLVERAAKVHLGMKSKEYSKLVTAACARKEDADPCVSRAYQAVLDDRALTDDDSRANALARKLLEYDKLGCAPKTSDDDIPKLLCEHRVRKACNENEIKCGQGDLSIDKYLKDACDRATSAGSEMRRNIAQCPIEGDAINPKSYPRKDVDCIGQLYHELHKSMRVCTHADIIEICGRDRAASCFVDAVVHGEGLLKDLCGKAQWSANLRFPDSGYGVLYKLQEINRILQNDKGVNKGLAKISNELEKEMKDNTSAIEFIENKCNLWDMTKKGSLKKLVKKMEKELKIKPMLPDFLLASTEWYKKQLSDMTGDADAEHMVFITKFIKLQMLGLKDINTGLHTREHTYLMNYEKVKNNRDEFKTICELECVDWYVELLKKTDDVEKKFEVVPEFKQHLQEITAENKANKFLKELKSNHQLKICKIMVLLHEHIVGADSEWNDASAAYELASSGEDEKDNIKTAIVAITGYAKETPSRLENFCESRFYEIQESELLRVSLVMTCLLPNVHHFIMQQLRKSCETHMKVFGFRMLYDSLYILRHAKKYVRKEASSVIVGVARAHQDPKMETASSLFFKADERPSPSSLPLPQVVLMQLRAMIENRKIDTLVVVADDEMNNYQKNIIEYDLRLNVNDRLNAFESALFSKLQKDTKNMLDDKISRLEADGTRFKPTTSVVKFKDWFTSFFSSASSSERDAWVAAKESMALQSLHLTTLQNQFYEILKKCDPAEAFNIIKNDVVMRMLLTCFNKTKSTLNHEHELHTHIAMLSVLGDEPLTEPDRHYILPKALEKGDSLVKLLPSERFHISNISHDISSEDRKAIVSYISKYTDAMLRIIPVYFNAMDDFQIKFRICFPAFVTNMHDIDVSPIVSTLDTSYSKDTDKTMEDWQHYRPISLMRRYIQVKTRYPGSNDTHKIPYLSSSGDIKLEDDSKIMFKTLVSDLSQEDS